jgi:hypothetical protein
MPAEARRSAPLIACELIHSQFGRELNGDHWPRADAAGLNCVCRLHAVECIHLNGYKMYLLRCHARTHEYASGCSRVFLRSNVSLCNYVCWTTYGEHHIAFPDFYPLRIRQCEQRQDGDDGVQLIHEHSLYWDTIQCQRLAPKQ